MLHISVIASVADPNSIRGRHGDDGMSGATRRACRDVRDDFNRRLKLDNGEDVEMRKKVLVLFGAVTLVWAGSLWMAFWSGFSCHLSVATVAAHGADRARLKQNAWLLQKIEDSDIESARASLSESVKLDDELVKLDKKTPKFGLADITLAGLTSPKELMALLNTAQELDDAHEQP